MAAAIPNVALVKEQSRPHVYFVCGGTKMWIPDPTDFAAVGFKWDKVRVVPDGTLAGFVDKPFVPPAATKASDVFFAPLRQCEAFSILVPDPLKGLGIGRWFPNIQPLESRMANNVLVVGWLTEDPLVHMWPHGCEDVFYNVELDPDFVARMYGPGGLSDRLNGQFYKGNLGGVSGGAPTASPPLLPVEDQERTALGSGSIGVTFNSFILPGGDWKTHGELNAWHVSHTSGDSSTWGWPHHYMGRGAAPSGWTQITLKDVVRPEGGGDPVSTTDSPWFPWNIYAPSGDRLRGGDYVMMRGPIWQDVVHGDGAKPETDSWHAGATLGHEGWVEMHPIDWIVRLQPRPPGLRKTGRYLARSTYVGQDVAIEGDYTIYPGFPPSAARRRLAVGNVDELIDGRCTDIATVIPHSRWGDFGQRRWKRFDDRVETRAKVQGTALRQGRFKASYIVSWRETDERDEVWIDDAVPAGSRALGNEPWLWVPDDPKPFTGTLSHKSQSLAGTHQHFFDSATSELSVAFGDVLFAMVHLDPDDPPRQVMLQWNDGSWEHRAYWGDTNLIGWGVDGAPSCRRMGPLPESGAWIRLEVPATVVNLAGRTLNGIAFTLYDGRATWDYAGKLVVAVPPPQPLDAVFVSQDVPDSAFTERLSRSR